MNYNEALEFIHSVSNYFCKPGLSRIKYLCAALGDPQNSLSFVHVAGTNGKGSTCAFLSEILKNAGYTVGTYSSPYILRFNERISVNGESVSNSDLAKICEKVKSVCDKMEDKPTEFEIITAIAFKYFEQKNCDIIVLVGKNRSKPMLSAVQESGFNRDNVYVVSSFREAMEVCAPLSDKDTVILLENDLPDNYLN